MQSSTSPITWVATKGPHLSRFFYTQVQRVQSSAPLRNSSVLNINGFHWALLRHQVTLQARVVFSPELDHLLLVPGVLRQWCCVYDTAAADFHHDKSGRTCLWEGFECQRCLKQSGRLCSSAVSGLHPPLSWLSSTEIFQKTETTFGLKTLVVFDIFILLWFC